MVAKSSLMVYNTFVIINYKLGAIAENERALQFLSFKIIDVIGCVDGGNCVGGGHTRWRVCSDL